jgi:TPR repeat protein
MDEYCEFTNLNSPITTLIKCFLVAVPCLDEVSEGDYDSAFAICDKAAVQKHFEAQFNTGIIHNNDRGTLKYDVQAYVWWNVTAAQGHKSAAKNKGIVDKNDTNPNM